MTGGPLSEPLIILGGDGLNPNPPEYSLPQKVIRNYCSKMQRKAFGMAKRMAYGTTTLKLNNTRLSNSNCKYFSSFTLISFKSHYYFMISHHLSTISSSHVTHTMNAKISTSLHQYHSTEIFKSRPRDQIGHGFSLLTCINQRKANFTSCKLRKDSHVETTTKRETGSGSSSLRAISQRGEMTTKKAEVIRVEKMVNVKKSSEQEKQNKGRKKSKKAKLNCPEHQLRLQLDMCSKTGDFFRAISLYDSAQRDGIKLGQYHYTVLLYLSSSAAVGILRPAKSGSVNRSVDNLDLTSVASLDSSKIIDNSNGDFDYEVDTRASGNKVLVKDDSQGVSRLNKMRETAPNGCIATGIAYNSIEGVEGSGGLGDCEIQVSKDDKRYALTRGFEIYENMRQENIPLNEATLTSVARMAMSIGNGDMAFEMVKEMKELGIKPRLRSYGPALFTYCSNGDIEKAFTVEQDMIENGVLPEEPELQALLRLSVRAGKGDKVYYLLHKMRTSLRQVSHPTADLIEMWFRSMTASRVGKRKWDEQLITESVKNGGGGWHGQGWLGKGKWTIARTIIGTDGVCEGCGEKLVTIDLDPVETENFAKSVASIAAKRDSSFNKFQKWLDYYGPFEAVVDAANVGLYSQRKFVASKVNVIVNGIRQKLSSKKWPLIVLHNKRTTGRYLEQSTNRLFFEKWKNVDALYATPTGSNDDWYWLYAAIKFKSLLVTNDEMRDHVFQLLGNDFFPRWKERHQVRFSFRDGDPEFHMPPPCSVVIQESEKGHWHIPIVSEHVSERERTWLCATRVIAEKNGSPRSPKGVEVACC